MANEFQSLLQAAGISAEVYNDKLAELLITEQLEGDTGDLTGRGQGEKK